MPVRFAAVCTAVVVQLLGPTTLPVFSQTAEATLRGAVLDPMRMPLAGATVTAAGPGTAIATTRTDAEGRFSCALAPGAYTVTIAASGFTDAVERVSIRAGQTTTHQFTLQIAGVREEVTVQGVGGYREPAITSATRTPTPLRDIPQSVTVVTHELIADQLMTSLADVVRYIPGVMSHQGENNRDQVIIRGNSSSADFFVNGVRDDVQYYRDLYNLDRVEALKGPNALMFGRGGAGGVINRVVKEAGFTPLREVTLQGGQYGNKRMSADVAQPLSSDVAVRFNGMVEDSGSFRRYVNVERGAFNPTLTIAPSSRTRIVVGYEYLRDRRVADRGITSFDRRPAAVPADTFYGNPQESAVRADVNLGSVAVEHRAGRVTVRNRMQLANYGRFYQNFVPGVVTADRAMVAVTAYNNATDRTNLFNQTDVTVTATTGHIRHTVLTGAEVGRQVTDNFRMTGFFNNTATTTFVPFDNPVTSVPVTYRQSATDADNHVRTLVAAAFVQDQVELNRHVQVLGGVRFDRFDLRYHNNRNDDTLQRPDNLVSPRAGVVVKPSDPLSLYGSYSVSFLPSSGDQFSSLTTLTQQLKPERFANYEVGAKWEPRQTLSVTTAIYRLDRTNTRSTDPNDPARIVQTGSQRTNGFEIGVNGQVLSPWSIAGGYAYQDAYVTSATAAARAGAVVGQVPHHTFSLWNHYSIHPRVSAGVGLIQRSEMFATIDNTVALPGYLRADAAAFFTVTKQARLQLNIENITNKAYYVNADSNTNISPGFPRAVRIALITRF